MDAQCNWSDYEFGDECGESLNLAINAVADVLHTLYNEAHTERRGDLNGDDPITAADAVIANSTYSHVTGCAHDPADGGGIGIIDNGL